MAIDIMSKIREQNGLELRSEKVRNIIGQNPSTLIYYAISAIGGGLLVLCGLIYFLPYKKVYTGTAVVKSTNILIASDSIKTSILLKFDRINTFKGEKLVIHLTSDKTHFEGKLLNISSTRDSLGRQEAQVRFVGGELKQIENQTVDFSITETSGNILSLIIEQFLSTP